MPAFSTPKDAGVFALRLAVRGLPFLLIPLCWDVLFVSEILESTNGTLCPTLDDAFIHFEYARSIALGRPLSYNPGDPATTGATSFLYIGLIAVGWAVGFRGLTTMWFANALAVVCLAIASWAAGRIGARVAGPTAGWACAIAVVAVPQFVFEALGGMEIALVTATHLLALLAAVEWTLREPHQRTPRVAALVCAAGALAAAARPEGITAAAPVAGLLVLLPPARRWVRALAPLAVLPTAFPAAVAWLATGQTRTTGQLSKWMFSDPYLTFDGALLRTEDNVERLFVELLAGEHPQVLIGPVFRWLVLAGLLALVFGVVKRHRGRGLLLALAFVSACAAVFLPPTYWTFDTNRGRYLWPFVPVLAVCVMIGACALGRALARSRLRLANAAAVLSATGLALFVTRPVDALEMVADSASEICGQHLPMAARVRALPEDAVIAVNDAGALRYLTGHRIYDLVGLTTPNAGTPWNAGMGSVFERIEHEPAGRLPSFIAYYPRWLRLPIGGEQVFRAALEHANHVGGAVMELRRVRSELFGSGALPVTVSGEPVDALDVADLESERAHGYRVELGARNANFLTVHSLEGRAVADGGRLSIGGERFVLRARAGVAATYVMRIEPRASCTLSITWNGAELASQPIQAGRGWRELSFPVPAERVRARNDIERRCAGEGEIAVHHDWLFQG